MHTIIEIKEEYLNDNMGRTEITIKYLTWDTEGKAIENIESMKLTPKAQDEIVAGLKKLYNKLKRFE
jgi:hypothetical protein